MSRRYIRISLGWSVIQKGMDMTSQRLGLAFFVMACASAWFPTAASASGWDIDPQSGKFPLAFTVKGGAAEWTTSSSRLQCLSVSGSGRFETATTGQLELTFHGCAAPSFVCTSFGQPSGTVTTSEMEFHTVFLEPGKAKPGILITAKEGLFASFTCNGFAMSLSGTGLISEMAAPKCGEASKTSTQLYESSTPGTQKWMQVETEGTKYDLAWTLGGTAAFNGATTVTFAEQATVTC
jgi:hypothetical protein